MISNASGQVYQAIRVAASVGGVGHWAGNGSCIADRTFCGRPVAHIETSVQLKKGRCGSCDKIMAKVVAVAHAEAIEQDTSRIMEDWHAGRYHRDGQCELYGTDCVVLSAAQDTSRAESAHNQIWLHKTEHHPVDRTSATTRDELIERGRGLGLTELQLYANTDDLHRAVENASRVEQVL